MAKNVLLWLLNFYQRRVSPAIAPRCKYYPTCSEYAKQAVELHGAGKGFLMAAWRVLRCNPLSSGGFDPVPPIKDIKSRKNGKLK